MLFCRVYASADMSLRALLEGFTTSLRPCHVATYHTAQMSWHIVCFLLLQHSKANSACRSARLSRWQRLLGLMPLRSTLVLHLLQVGGALRGVGDIELAGKFDDACAKVKRDIVFAASLYL